VTTGQLQRERRQTRRGVSFFSSGQRYEDLAVVIRRFPRAKSAETARSFVLVHGIGVSSRYFHPLAEELAASGEVFLIDLAGYGSAPNPKRDVSIALHAKVLGTFLERAGIVNPVLVGHSMGCQVVTQLAVDRPELSDRLVLIGPTVYPPDRNLVTEGLHLVRDMLRESLRVNLIIMWDYLVRCGIPYYLAQVKHLLGDRMEDRLPRIEARTLVLRGRSDAIVPPAWCEAIAELVPLGTFDDVEGPHVVMFSDPVGTAERIVRHSA
jgi:pimeloyl-ACP methyl ester carboxylesterase